MSSLISKSIPEGLSVKENFFRSFGDEQRLLHEHIERLKDATLSESERQSLVDSCLSGLSQLSDEVNNASSFLPAYDQRTYSTAIRTLSQKLQSTRSASAPKRKFGFRKTTPGNEIVGESPTFPDAQGSVPSPSTQDATIGVPDSRPSAPAASDDNHPGILSISSLSSSHYLLRADALRPSVSITDVNHSFVDLSVSVTLARPFSTLAIKNVTESLLVCGQVSGAAHITGVKSSTLIIWSRQVRIHECHDCVVYLRCSSRPIIEDCHGIRFAPLPATYGLPSGEVPVPSPPNLWNQVDDFKWLRAEPSPNWEVLQADDERAIDDEGWGKIATCEISQIELDDLLRAAKIQRL